MVRKLEIKYLGPTFIPSEKDAKESDQCVVVIDKMIQDYELTRRSLAESGCQMDANNTKILKDIEEI